MGAISDRLAIDYWELGLERHPLDRRLLLLAGATQEGVDSASLDVEARDRVLLGVRRETFGDPIVLYGRCSQCDTELEFTTSVSALLEIEPVASRPVAWQQWTVEVRLPTSADLAAALNGTADLLTACVASITHHDAPCDPADLPAGARAGVEAALEEAAPLADLELVVTCAECGAVGRFPFDAGDLLWDEVADRARRVMDDVVVLARFFGWTEAEVLALPTRRRRSYIEAVV